MSAAGEHTHHEILTQPEAWSATLEVLRSQEGTVREVFDRGGYQAVVFTGCGSTYYLSLAAAAQWRELAGLPAWGVPASEIWLRPQGSLPTGQRTLLVAISRSGATTETVRACETFLKGASPEDLITVTNYAGRPLANLGGTNLVLPAGQEQSVAQTRAFTTLYLATMFLAAVRSGSRSLLDQMGMLPAAARRLLSVHADRARQLASDDSLDRFYFLGSGPCYGLACELSLKMKEMSLSHSEPFHFLEFRHGPQSMVTAGTLVVGLLSEGTRFHEEAVLGEMRARGAQVLTMAEQEADVAFGSGVGGPLQSILHLPVGQLLGFERAMFRGLDPDHPHNLSAVVTLDPM